jgi:hypothetical protein
MYVKYRCNCIFNTTQQKELALKCPNHHQDVQDWSSDYRSPYRVVIYWQDEKVAFALHQVSYDGQGFIRAISPQPATPFYATTVELAQEARHLGLNSDEISNIFYDRYLEYHEFFSLIGEK